MKPGTINQRIIGSKNIIGGRDVRVEEHHHYPGPSPVIPRQLPPLDACFLGRDRELAELVEQLHPGKVVAVCGPGGMGKSALAAQAVHKLEEDRFPDGIVFHTFYGHPETDQALQAVCEAFRIEAKASLAAAVRNALSGRKALLILDGAEEANDLPALLKLCGWCGVLITSRKRSDALALPLEIKPLEEQAAAEVFCFYSRAAADDASVQGICKILDGWPVGLRIAGRYLNSTGESAREYLCWLEQEPFKELGDGEHQEENAALLLRRSVEQVSEDARLALGLAGTLAFAPIGIEPVIVAVSTTSSMQPQGFWPRLKTFFLPADTSFLQYSTEDKRRSRLALHELVNYGLLENRQERWQISHALVHTYARTELALSRGSIDRLSAYYIDFCKAQSKAGLKGYARLDRERTHCLRLMESCLNNGLWQKTRNLVEAITLYLDKQGYWVELMTALGMTLTAARQAKNRMDEAWSQHHLGYIYTRCGKYTRALECYEQSLVITRKLGDRKTVGGTLNNIAEIYREQRKFKDALQYYEQSLSIQREVGDRQGEGVLLNNIGQLYAERGDNKRALKYYQQGLSISREVGDNELEGKGLTNLGAIYRLQGNYTKAIEYRKQALDICRKVGDKVTEAQVCKNIGLTYAEQGNIAQAEEYIVRAIQIGETFNHPLLGRWRQQLSLVRRKRRGKQKQFTKRPSRKGKR